MLLLVGLPNLVGVILKGGVDKLVSSSFYGASLAIQFLSPLPLLAKKGADQSTSPTTTTTTTTTTEEIDLEVIPTTAPTTKLHTTK